MVKLVEIPEPKAAKTLSQRFLGALPEGPRNWLSVISNCCCYCLFCVRAKFQLLTLKNYTSSAIWRGSVRFALDVLFVTVKPVFMCVNGICDNDLRTISNRRRRFSDTFRLAWCSPRKRRGPCWLRRWLWCCRLALQQACGNWRMVSKINTAIARNNELRVTLRKVVQPQMGFFFFFFFFFFSHTTNTKHNMHKFAVPAPAAPTGGWWNNRTI